MDTQSKPPSTPSGVHNGLQFTNQVKTVILVPVRGHSIRWYCLVFIFCVEITQLFETTVNEYFMVLSDFISEMRHM